MLKQISPVDEFGYAWFQVGPGRKKLLHVKSSEDEAKELKVGLTHWKPVTFTHVEDRAVTCETKGQVKAYLKKHGVVSPILSD